MENMVSEVIQGTLMETVRAAGGRKQWEENIKTLHMAKYAVKLINRNSISQLYCQLFP